MPSRQYTKRQLDTMAKQRCGEIRATILKRRVGMTRADFGRDDIEVDVKKVVAACSLDFPPYIARIGTNNDTLWDAHPLLQQFYHNVGLQIGQTPPRAMQLYHVKPYPAGHCAEPHAVHRLFNSVPFRLLQGVTVNNLLFSTAFDIKNNAPHPYCGTCLHTFPQLR